MNCPKCGHLTDKKPLFSTYYDHCPVCDGNQDCVDTKKTQLDPDQYLKSIQMDYLTKNQWKEINHIGSILFVNRNGYSLGDINQAIRMQSLIEDLGLSEDDAYTKVIKNP